MLKPVTTAEMKAETKRLKAYAAELRRIRKQAEAITAQAIKARVIH